MEKDIIVKLHKNFEQSVYKDEETGLEFWLARDLQNLLGYARWENFAKVIEKAKTACRTAGFDPADHFLDITKMVSLGSGAEREIDDISLTRYACYLIAQNGDPSKDQIAFAQTYFAVQTRKQEIIEKRIAEIERLNARRKLSLSEKELSGIIYERLSDEKSFARIRSKGDTALFGGRTTEQMKQKLNIPKSRALADFLPTITIKAEDFANEITNFVTVHAENKAFLRLLRPKGLAMTQKRTILDCFASLAMTKMRFSRERLPNFNIKRDYLRTEAGITREHVKNNQEVRKLLIRRNIKPEALPPAEDAKKLERKLASEQKKLIAKAEPLDTAEDKSQNN